MCGTLVENQSVILKVVGSNPITIYFEESELCVLLHQINNTSCANFISLTEIVKHVVGGRN